MADQVGLNKKYLSTQFTRRCGCTFISYLNNLRLRYAQELLARTDLKIYEISDRVGYSRFPDCSLSETPRLKKLFSKFIILSSIYWRCCKN